MDCPYIIRENIGFGRVREHGYYQLDEMAYDLTHNFADADVEVITRPSYNVVMESGEELSQLDDDTVFKMLSAGLPVKYIENARDGYIMYSRPESKPAVEVKRVGGITRASASREQYDDAIIIPMAKEWAVLDRADIGDHYRVMEFKDNAINMFEQKTERKWCNRPFYDEVRLYHNGMLVRLSVNGHEFIFLHRRFRPGHDVKLPTPTIGTP